MTSSPSLSPTLTLSPYPPSVCISFSDDSNHNTNQCNILISYCSSIASVEWNKDDISAFHFDSLVIPPAPTATFNHLVDITKDKEDEEEMEDDEDENDENIHNGNDNDNDNDQYVIVSDSDNEGEKKEKENSSSSPPNRHQREKKPRSVHIIPHGPPVIRVLRFVPKFVTPSLPLSIPDSALPPTPSHPIRSPASPSQNTFLCCTEDKYLRLISIIGHKIVLSSSSVTKKKVSVSLYDSSSSVLYVGDKFGDLYSLNTPHLSISSIRLGHFSILTASVFSTDNKYLITSDIDGKIRVSHHPHHYDVKSFCLGHAESVTQLAMIQSPHNHSNDYLVSGGIGNHIWLWDYQNGKVLQKFSIPLPSIPNDKNVSSLPNDLTYISSLTYSKDNTQIAVGVWPYPIVFICHLVSSSSSSSPSLAISSTVSLPHYPISCQYDGEGRLWIVTAEGEIIIEGKDKEHFSAIKDKLQHFMKEAKAVSPASAPESTALSTSTSSFSPSSSSAAAAPPKVRLSSPPLPCSSFHSLYFHHLLKKQREIHFAFREGERAKKREIKEKQKELNAKLHNERAKVAIERKRKEKEKREEEGQREEGDAHNEEGGERKEKIRKIDDANMKE